MAGRRCVPNEINHYRLPYRLGCSQHLGRHAGFRRFGHQHDDVRLLIAGKQVDALEGRRGTDVTAEITRARADGMRHACPQVLQIDADRL